MSFENHLPILQAVESVIGHRPHVQSVRRWIKKGVRGVRLEAVFINGKYLTSLNSVQRFIEQSTAIRLEVAEPPKVEILKPVKASRVDRAIKEFNKLAKAK
jgi:hypothetical protein